MFFKSSTQLLIFSRVRHMFQFLPEFYFFTSFNFIKSFFYDVEKFFKIFLFGFSVHFYMIIFKIKVLHKFLIQVLSVVRASRLHKFLN